MAAFKQKKNALLEMPRHQIETPVFLKNIKHFRWKITIKNVLL